MWRGGEDHRSTKATHEARWMQALFDGNPWEAHPTMKFTRVTAEASE
jgi:hypothetical protein